MAGRLILIHDTEGRTYMKLTSDEQIYMVNGQSFFGMGELREKEVLRIQMLDGGTGLNI